MTNNKNKLKCIYAILDSNQELDLVIKGLDSSFVYTVNYKNISVAVSDIDKDNLKVNPECALTYERIIENIMARCTLLPMRFGTLAKDDREAIGILEKYYDGFVNNLKQVKGKTEYGLKVLWAPEEASVELKSEDSNKVEQMKGNSLYKKYLLEKFKKHKIEEALLKKADIIIENIHYQLEKLSFLSKFEKMATKRLILDAVYLVEKEKKDVFIQTVEELKREYQNLKFLLTGPWPPYNFATTEPRRRGICSKIKF